jgi:hypothetical protein
MMCYYVLCMHISNISIYICTEMCTNNKFVSTLIWKRCFYTDMKTSRSIVCQTKGVSDRNHRTVRGTTETCRHQVNERSAWLPQHSMKVNCVLKCARIINLFPHWYGNVVSTLIWKRLDRLCVRRICIW